MLSPMLSCLVVLCFVCVGVVLPATWRFARPGPGRNPAGGSTTTGGQPIGGGRGGTGGATTALMP